MTLLTASYRRMPVTSHVQRTDARAPNTSILWYLGVALPSLKACSSNSSVCGCENPRLHSAMLLHSHVISCVSTIGVRGQEDTQMCVCSGSSWPRRSQQTQPLQTHSHPRGGVQHLS